MNEFKLNFLDDYLLLDSINSKNFTTANDILSKRKELVILPNNILNLYTTLVKRIDFTPRKIVGTMPFFLMKTEELIEFLPPSYKANFYWKLRKAFSFYNNRKRIGRTESFRLWFRKESFPATLIRLIANIASSNRPEELEILSKLIEEIQFVNNFQSEGRIYLPKTLDELNNPKLAYFSGSAMGDGGFCLGDYWVLVDGDKSGNLKCSYEYMVSIKQLLSNIFQIKFTSNNPRRRGNRLELWVSNKWFCRFINFFLGLPYGKRTKLERPKVFSLFSNYKELNKLFLRGVFDAEGSICNGNISLSSNDRIFLEKCKKELLDLGIKTGKISNRNLHVNNASTLEFAKNIGFSHSKKLKNLLLRLQKGSGSTKFIGIKKDFIFNGKYFDLSRLNDIRIYGLNEDIKYIRTKLNFFQKDLAVKLSATKNIIFGWENTIGIPFTKFYELWKLFGKDLDELFELLYQRDVRWGIGIRPTKKVKLPLRINNEIIRIAKFVRPYSNQLRILKEAHNKRIFDTIRKTFGVEIIETRKDVYEILSSVLAKFFSTFFIYNRCWDSLSHKEIKDVKKNLTKIWD